jgi:hypothetical protein
MGCSNKILKRKLLLPLIFLIFLLKLTTGYLRSLVKP